MNILDIANLALRSIRGNLLRSILTLSIIAIGIMALVGILTAIDGIKAGITTTFEGLGANTLTIKRKGSGIMSGGHGHRNDYDPLSYDEAMDFKKRYDYPSKVAVTAGLMPTSIVKFEEKKSDPNIFVRAIDEVYLTLGTAEVGLGRNFSEAEVKAGTGVTVIGEGIVKKLFDNSEKALDQIISINNNKYRVVGILASKGSSGIFSSDNLCLVPVLNAKRNFPYSKRSYTLNIAIDPDYDIDSGVSEATGLMRSVRRLALGESEDFEITKSDKLSGILVEQVSYLAIAAYIIAAITLFGAAIGLMNIMLVAVNERTREIGISKAIGAKNKTILFQFLGEAIIICQLGGLVGIVLGLIAGNLVSMMVKGPFLIPWLWILVGITFCLFVGVFAGIYPAIKASRLDPIESLRYE